MKRLLFLFFYLFLSIQFSFAQKISINEFMAINDSVILDAYGESDDWIELFNTTSDTINLNGWYFTDEITGTSRFKATCIGDELKIAPSSYLIFWADNNPEQGSTHLGIKLSGEGEEIGILDTNGYLIDYVIYPAQRKNISMGKALDTSNIWVYFDTSTPGYENPLSYYYGIVNPPVFNISGGIYSTSQQIQITAGVNEDIYFSTDFSFPDTTSFAYTHAIDITSNAIIRAAAYKEGFLPSDVVSNAYLFDKEYSLPILSIITDSSNLWGPTGIYSNPWNEGIAWERFCQLQFLDEGENTISINGGIRIQGGNSLDMPKKSFRLYFRDEYGQSRCEYQVFGPNTIASFKNLVLKSGYDDDITTDNGTLLRDALSAEYWRNLGKLSTQSTWVSLYLNDSFWGIYNLRESINENFITDNTGLTNFDIVRYQKEGPELVYGSMNEWNKLSKLMDTLDFSDPAAFDILGSHIDMAELVDLVAFIHCTAYKTWGWGIFMYKERIPSGRWKYLIWDTDKSYLDANWNQFTAANDTVGLRWANKLLLDLGQNELFNEKFIIRTCDLLNTHLFPSSSLPVLENLYNTITPDMPYELQRWAPSNTRWESNIQGMRNFLTNHPDALRSQMQTKFGFDTIRSLQLRIEGKGYVQVNTVTVDHFTWTGFYFREIPVSLKAIPRPGYKFTDWQNISATDDSVSFNLDFDTLITAMFESDPSIADKQIIINEICYQPLSAYPTDDWIELFNPNPFEVNISGWKLKDEDNSHLFTLPSNTIIPSQQYLVLVQDEQAFSAALPEIVNITGNFGDGSLGFGLSDNDRVRLYNASGTIIDSVDYRNGFPWPFIIDSIGGSLQLCDPYADNNISSNWNYVISIPHTPGSANACFSDPLPINSYHPMKPAIAQNYPNPFSDHTNISLTLQSDEHVEVYIFDMNMRIMKVIARGYFPQGSYIFSWDGTNETGTKMSPGIYFYTLKTQNSFTTKKLLLIY